MPQVKCTEEKLSHMKDLWYLYIRNVETITTEEVEVVKHLLDKLSTIPDIMNFPEISGDYFVIDERELKVLQSITIKGKEWLHQQRTKRRQKDGKAIQHSRQ